MQYHLLLLILYSYPSSTSSTHHHFIMNLSASRLLNMIEEVSSLPKTIVVQQSNDPLLRRLHRYLLALSSLSPRRQVHFNNKSM
jgi:hypothetical protein